MIWIIISAVIALLDQLVKYKVVNGIQPSDTVQVVNNFFYLTHVKNRGAAWSILQNGRIFFIILAIAGCIGITYYLFKKVDNMAKLALSFIMGGALGNLVDRVITGEVTDFLEFHFGTYIFPIFNVADIFIVVGTVILVIYMLFFSSNESKKSSTENS
jgi:signal peptidase II